MDELAQAGATNSRSDVLALGPDPVTCITIYEYSYHAGSSPLWQSFCIMKTYISFLMFSLLKING